MERTTFNQTEALSKAREELATHRAEIAELRRDIADLKDVFDSMADALQGIQVTLAEARGGWRTFVGIGTAFASLGAGLAWLIDHLIKRGP